MKIAIIYHKADCDGICSAALANLFLSGEKVFFPITYGDPAPDLAGFDWVYILDYTFKPEVMWAYHKGFGEKLIWIDHHEKAVKAVADYANFSWGRLFEHAACYYVWKWFSNSPVPKWVEYLSEWDMWRHTPEVLQFNAYCAQYMRDPTNIVWEHLYKNIANIPVMSELGHVIRDVEERYDNNALKRLYTGEYEGYTFAAINESCDGQVFKKYDGKVDIHIFYYRKEAEWKVSIRKGNSGRELHCGDLAKRWGDGNGHVGASSMVLTKLPEWLQ